MGRKTMMLLGGAKKPLIKNMEMVFNPLVKQYRKVKVATVDTGFWKVDTSEEFEGMVPKQEDGADYGYAMCIARIAEEPAESGPSSDGSVKEVVGEKKPKYQGAYLESWEGDAPMEFMAKCNEGGEENWTKIMRRPRVYVKPKETIKVQAPSRKG